MSFPPNDIYAKNPLPIQGIFLVENLYSVWQRIKYRDLSHWLIHKWSKSSVMWNRIVVNSHLGQLVHRLVTRRNDINTRDLVPFRCSLTMVILISVLVPLHRCLLSGRFLGIIGRCRCLCYGVQRMETVEEVKFICCSRARCREGFLSQFKQNGVLIIPSKYCLSRIGLWQSIPVTLTEKVFPGQMGYLITPRWACPEELLREISRTHPNQMPKPPPLAPFDA